MPKPRVTLPIGQVGQQGSTQRGRTTDNFQLLLFWQCPPQLVRVDKVAFQAKTRQYREVGVLRLVLRQLVG